VKNAWPLTTADAEFCRRCGEPLPQNASTPTPQEADISSYSASDELPEPPRNALDELMHLALGAHRIWHTVWICSRIAEIIALVVLVIILIVFAVVLDDARQLHRKLFFGNLTSLRECDALKRQVGQLYT